MSATTAPAMNLAQQEAVNYLHGPCLVLAGAGSGKTRVITHKIARLIQMDMPAKRIAAITFTNKAAAEMRERAKSLIGKAAKDVLVCTFHALGVRMLRQDGAVLGLKANFSILDTDDVTSILKDAGGSTDAATARQRQWVISAWKSAGLNAAQALALAETEEQRVTATVMGHYEERLLAYQSVDFDDLISLPLKLLQNHPDVRQRWQQQMGHVLVDEYQDTNATQYALLKLLVGDPATARFTAVGDDDQSIYGWRGATLENLKQLPLDFPTLKVVKLEQNYRSTSAILRAANNVIGPNPKLFPKNLWSDLGEGEPVRVVDADHEEHEAERAVARIQGLCARFLPAGHGEGSVGAGVTAPGRPKQGTAPSGGSEPHAVGSVGAGVTAPGRPKQGTAPSGGSEPHAVGSVGAGVTPTEFRDFAVLYRANHQAKPFEKALRKANIPYKVSGGQSFFDRAEIRDLCAWFRLWANNDDDPAFVRAVTTPKRGIGHQTLGTLGVFASQYKVSLFEALFSSSLTALLSGKALGSLHEFGRYVNDLQYRARQSVGAESAAAFLADWLQEIGYEKHLRDSEDSQPLADAKWANVGEFCEWMALRCGGKLDGVAGVDEREEKSLLEVAQTIALLSTLTDRQTEQNVVTLSTLHAAKGLEWPHVLLVGVNEGVLPFKQAENPEDERSAEQLSVDLDTRLQEERRLMYVGITRAQRSLAVSWTRRRKKGREQVTAQPSRFIAEMALDAATAREDPREKLRALRAEFARRAEARSEG